jgi:hypothetical protein
VNEVEKAELSVLFALFVEHHARPNSYVDLEDLYQRYNLNFPKTWLASSVSDWEAAGWVDVSRSHDDTAAMLDDNRYNAVLKRILAWLGASTLTIDGAKEEILSDKRPPSDIPMINGWKWFTIESDQTSASSGASSAPASDRMVPLNHNEQNYLLVESGIRELSEAVRSINDLPIEPEERDRILAGLSAASALWASAQLKVIQIKVGVLMAIEDAARALTNTIKAVAVAVFVDAIKSIVKNHVGIDLDKL